MHTAVGQGECDLLWRREEQSEGICEPHFCDSLAFSSLLTVFPDVWLIDVGSTTIHDLNYSDENARKTRDQYVDRKTQGLVLVACELDKQYGKLIRKLKRNHVWFFDGWVC